jgi:hypothetical protein
MTVRVRASFKIDFSFKFANEFVNESAFNRAVFMGCSIVIGACAVGGYNFNFEVRK